MVRSIIYQSAHFTQESRFHFFCPWTISLLTTRSLSLWLFFPLTQAEWGCNPFRQVCVQMWDKDNVPALGNSPHLSKGLCLKDKCTKPWIQLGRFYHLKKKYIFTFNVALNESDTWQHHVQWTFASFSFSAVLGRDVPVPVSADTCFRRSRKLRSDSLINKHYWS